MAEERGLRVDKEGFEAAMAAQKERSRAAGKKATSASLKFEAEATAHLQRSGVPLTDDLPKSASFPPPTSLARTCTRRHLCFCIL